VDFGHYNDLAVVAAAELVNTVGSVSGDELLPTAAAAREFLSLHDFSFADELAEADLEDLRAIRERLRIIFFAPGDDVAVEQLNRLLFDLQLNPFLTDHDGRWHLHYATDDTSVARRVGAAMAMGLASMIAEHGFSRVGACAADDCEDVFIDTSRNHSRRFCCEGCSSRTNVAAFRARKSATNSQPV